MRAMANIFSNKCLKLLNDILILLCICYRSVKGQLMSTYSTNNQLN